MDYEIIDVSKGQGVGTGIRQVTVTLPSPQARLRIRVGQRSPGRAEAVFEGKSWSAKHYWEEGQGVWVYEFDDTLPSGRITVRVPIAEA